MEELRRREEELTRQEEELTRQKNAIRVERHRLEEAAELLRLEAEVKRVAELLRLEDERIRLEEIEAKRVEDERIRLEEIEAKRVEDERIRLEEIEAKRVEDERIRREEVTRKAKEEISQLENANTKEALDCKKIAEQLLDTTLLKQEMAKNTLLNQEITNLEAQLKEKRAAEVKSQEVIEKHQNEYTINLARVENHQENVKKREIIRVARIDDLKEQLQLELSPIAAPLVLPIAAPLVLPVAAPVPVALPVPVAAPLVLPIAAPLVLPVAAPVPVALPVPVAAPVAAVERKRKRNDEGDDNGLLQLMLPLVKKKVATLKGPRNNKIYKRERVEKGQHNYPLTEEGKKRWEAKGIPCVPCDPADIKGDDNYDVAARKIASRSFNQVRQDIKKYAEEQWLDFRSEPATVEKSFLRFCGDDAEFMAELDTLAELETFDELQTLDELQTMAAHENMSL